MAHAWKWYRFDGAGVFWLLEAKCEHGNDLTLDGVEDFLSVHSKGKWMEGGKIKDLPCRVRLWSKRCGCSVDVLVEKDRRVYWLNEIRVEEI